MRQSSTPQAASSRSTEGGEEMALKPNVKKGTTDFRSGGVKAAPPTKITWSPPPSKK